MIGLLVDEARSLLWVCNSDLTGKTPPSAVGFDLKTATQKAKHTFPGKKGFCNDLALDAKGNLYMTDSLGARIIQVPAADVMGTDKAKEWSKDAKYVLPPGKFGLNGIVSDGKSFMYAVSSTKGELYRIPIKADGSAGSVTIVTLPRALKGADGIKAIDAKTLVVVEQDAGALTRISLSGDKGTLRVLTNRLDVPSTFAFQKKVAWVVESQLDHMLGFDKNPPMLPFQVVRVILP